MKHNIPFSTATKTLREIVYNMIMAQTNLDGGRL